MSGKDEEKKIFEKLPSLDRLPDEEEEKEEPSIIRKLDMKFDQDCVTCKFISASVCYASGVLVFSTIKQIHPSKIPAKIMTGLFGLGLFVAGTLRLFVTGNDPNAPLFGQARNENVDSDSST